METMVCTKCSVEKPLTSEYFHRCKREKSGFHATCKECRNAQKRDYRKTNPSKSKEYWDRHREKYKEKYETYQKVYYEKNKEKIKRYYKINQSEYHKYYRTHREKILQRANDYYKNNREKALQRADAYYKNNKGKIKYHYNPEKSLQKRQKRRALKKSLIATFTEEQWNECKKHFGYKCAYCGKKEKLEQEHFVPLSKGGEYTVKNIIPSCKSCNASKNNKNFFEWYSKQPLYSKVREKKIMNYLEIKDGQQQIALF